MIQSTPDCAWFFEYRLDGDKEHIIAVIIDKYGRVEVSLSRRPQPARNGHHVRRTKRRRLS